MADLKQALIWLAEGRKIRRKHWISDRYRVLDNGLCCDPNGVEDATFHFAGDDWELYEDPKPVKEECQSCMANIMRLDIKIGELENRLKKVEKPPLKDDSGKGHYSDSHSFVKDFKREEFINHDKHCVNNGRCREIGNGGVYCNECDGKWG